MRPLALCKHSRCKVRSGTTTTIKAWQTSMHNPNMHVNWLDMQRTNVMSCLDRSCIGQHSYGMKWPNVGIPKSIAPLLTNFPLKPFALFFLHWNYCEIWAAAMLSVLFYFGWVLSFCMLISHVSTRHATCTFVFPLCIYENIYTASIYFKILVQLSEDRFCIYLVQMIVW